MLEASGQGDLDTGYEQTVECSGQEQGLARFYGEGQTVSILGSATTEFYGLGLKMQPADSWPEEAPPQASCVGSHSI